MIPWYWNHIPFHIMPYHTIPFHLIPYHVIPSHHPKPVTGCLGPFLQYMKLISAGCNTGPLGSIFCGQVLQIFAVISSYKYKLYDECDPLKIRSIGFYPMFSPFTLWIIHHKPLKIVYLARPCNELNINHKYINTASITMAWLPRSRENKTFVCWLSVMNNAKLCPWQRHRL